MCIEMFNKVACISVQTASNLTGKPDTTIKSKITAHNSKNPSSPIKPEGQKGKQHFYNSEKLLSLILKAKQNTNNAERRDEAATDKLEQEARLTRLKADTEEKKLISFETVKNAFSVVFNIILTAFDSCSEHFEKTGNTDAYDYLKKRRNSINITINNEFSKFIKKIKK